MLLIRLVGVVSKKPYRNRAKRASQNFAIFRFHLNKPIFQRPTVSVNKFAPLTRTRRTIQLFA